MEIQPVKKYREWKENYNESIRSAKTRRVMCKCPMCGKIYYKQIHWGGREPARLYCRGCYYICEDEYIEPLELHINL